MQNPITLGDIVRSDQFLSTFAPILQPRWKEIWYIKVLIKSSLNVKQHIALFGNVMEFSKMNTERRIFELTNYAKDDILKSEYNNLQLIDIVVNGQRLYFDTLMYPQFVMNILRFYNQKMNHIRIDSVPEKEIEFWLSQLKKYQCPPNMVGIYDDICHKYKLPNNKPKHITYKDIIMLAPEMLLGELRNICFANVELFTCSVNLYNYPQVVQDIINKLIKENFSKYIRLHKDVFQQERAMHMFDRLEKDIQYHYPDFFNDDKIIYTEEEINGYLNLIANTSCFSSIQRIIRWLYRCGVDLEPLYEVEEMKEHLPYYQY